MSKLERAKVASPVWRKKVDDTLLHFGYTPIPHWVSEMWRLGSQRQMTNSKKDPRSVVEVTFQKVVYRGHLTESSRGKGRQKPLMRLFLPDELREELRRTFMMSNMRLLEGRLAGDGSAVEARIPFWEFLDIEYADCFILTAHYVQDPIFPNLFRTLIGSAAMSAVNDSILGKDKPRIYKEPWKKRSELNLEPMPKNCLYVLRDDTRRLLYVGQAKDLVKRLRQDHPSIPDWEHYRYDLLPSELAPFRITLERMLIRDYAFLFDNSKGIDCLDSTSYRLTNELIDSC